MTPEQKVARIAAVEHRIAREYKNNQIKTPIHLCIGQEATCVAVCEPLTSTDLLFAYYRSHGWYLAKGGNLNRMIAELYGKPSGCSGGTGGSMHLIDESVGFQGTTAIVGSQISHAVGAALALQLQENEKDIVVCVFGDGASEQGVFMESLMFAALRRLKVLFVCMNDHLATNVPVYERQPRLSGPAVRAQAFGVDSLIIDATSNVYSDISRKVEKIIDNVRELKKPYLLEMTISRQCEHVGPRIGSLAPSSIYAIELEVVRAFRLCQ